MPPEDASEAGLRARSEVGVKKQKFGGSEQDAPNSARDPPWFRKVADHAPRRGGQDHPRLTATAPRTRARGACRGRIVRRKVSSFLTSVMSWTENILQLLHQKIQEWERLECLF